MHRSLAALGSWASAPLVVLGAGPSLRAMDFRRLRALQAAGTCRVLAVQGALYAAPWADAAALFDRNFIAERRSALRHLSLPLILAAEKPSSWQTEELPEGSVLLARKAGSKTLSDDPAVLNWSTTSGFHALQVAALLGVSRALLCGYDYAESLQAHHYDEGVYSSHKPRPRDWPNWAKDFDGLQDELLRVGLSVRNASPGSAVAAFPLCDAQTGLDWIEAGAPRLQAATPQTREELLAWP